MSATVTFIVGLCGSGKSCLIERMPETVKFDEGFDWNRDGEYERLTAALRSGIDCAVVEIAYSQKPARDRIVDFVTLAVPGVIVKFVCFENDVGQANQNCRERRDGRDTDRLVAINNGLTRHYSCPEGAKTLPVWRPKS